MGKTVNNNNYNNPNNEDLLASLYFATKTRGSSTSNGDTACYNAKTRRLTIGAYYRNNGYRSGALALDKNGAVIMSLKKDGYDGRYSAIHATQHFFTVVKNSPVLEKLTTRHYTVNVVDADNDLFKLTPVA